MTARKHATPIASLFTAGALALAGCADAPADTVELQTEAPLQLAASAQKWPNGIVNTCWTAHAQQHTNSSGVNDFATLAQLVQDRTGDTWGRAANLRFVGWGSCPANPQNVIAIDLADDGAGNSGIGWAGTTGVVNMHLGVQRGDFSGSLVPHEFGHALGFTHEMARADFVDDSMGACMEGNVAGNTLGTPPDRQSIMASTGYCQNNPNLSVWDIVGVQNAYGRKAAGSVVGLHNRCIDIPLNGPPPPIGTDLQVFDCGGSTNQQWRYTTSSQLFAPAFSNAFMDDEGGTGANQSSVQIFSQHVPVTTNQQFQFTGVTMRGIGEMCVDVPNANFANNQLLQIFTCNGGNNQSWNLGADGTISNGSFCWDVPSGSTASGTKIQIFACNGGNNQKFTLSNLGELKFGGQCIDVIGGQPNNNSQLQLFPCKAESDQSRMNQRWHVNGAIHSMTRCLDIRGGVSVNHAAMQIFDCVANAANQTWDWYFNR